MPRLGGIGAELVALSHQRRIYLRLNDLGRHTGKVACNALGLNPVGDGADKARLRR